MKEGMPSRLMKPAGDGEGTVGGGQKQDLKMSLRKG